MCECKKNYTMSEGFFKVKLIDEIKYSLFDKIYHFFKGKYIHYIDKEKLGQTVNISYILVNSTEFGPRTSYYLDGKFLHRKVIESIIN